MPAKVFVEEVDPAKVLEQIIDRLISGDLVHFEARKCSECERFDVQLVYEEANKGHTLVLQEPGMPDCDGVLQVCDTADWLTYIETLVDEAETEHGLARARTSRLRNWFSKPPTSTTH